MRNLNLSVFNFFLLVFCTLHTTFPFANGQSAKVEPVCIDDLEDFERSHWILGKGSYAENTDVLSNILQQEIESANGIFYFVGRAADNTIVSDLTADQFSSPTFMYVKYYGYFPSQGMQDNMIVYPAADPSDEGPWKILDKTPGIEWGEAVIEMDNNPQFPGPYEVTALNLGLEEYFLVDKIIILHEDLGQDFEAIQAKCPPKETTSTDTPSTTVSAEPTSTSTSKTSTTSTEAPSVPFSCQEPGFFRGSDCSTFHVCLFEKSSVFGNLMFHCPTPQVWCQSSWRCEDAQVCPCSI